MESTRLNNEEALRQMFITSTLKISPSEWKNARKSDAMNREKQKALTSIIIKCTERAYFDYNRTLEFKDENVNRCYFRKELYKATFKQIKKLITVKEASSFNFERWHNDACNAIKDTANRQNALNSEDSFSYGQAQKQLNMTIKYMWLLGLWPILDSITDQLHATVDNYIIKAAWEKDEIYLPVAENVLTSLGKKKLKRSETKYYPYKLKSVWTQWDEKTYEKFQKTLRAYVKSEGTYSCIFEWELNTWNRIATKDNNHYDN